jgi:hypothetical protein
MILAPCMCLELKRNKPQWPCFSLFLGHASRTSPICSYPPTTPSSSDCYVADFLGIQTCFRPGQPQFLRLLCWLPSCFIGLVTGELGSTHRTWKHRRRCQPRDTRLGLRLKRLADPPLVVTSVRCRCPKRTTFETAKTTSMSAPPSHARPGRPELNNRHKHHPRNLPALQSLGLVQLANGSSHRRRPYPTDAILLEHSPLSWPRFCPLLLLSPSPWTVKSCYGLLLLTAQSDLRTRCTTLPDLNL